MRPRLSLLKVDKKGPSPIDKKGPSPIDKKGPSPIDKKGPSLTKVQNKSAEFVNNFTVDKILLILERLYYIMYVKTS